MELLSSTSVNGSEIWKQSVAELNFIPTNLFHRGVVVELWMSGCGLGSWVAIVCFGDVATLGIGWSDLLDKPFFYYVLPLFHFLTSSVNTYNFILIVPVRKCCGQLSFMGSLCSCIAELAL